MLGNLTPEEVSALVDWGSIPHILTSKQEIVQAVTSMINLRRSELEERFGNDYRSKIAISVQRAVTNAVLSERGWLARHHPYTVAYERKAFPEILAKHVQVQLTARFSEAHQPPLHEEMPPAGRYQRQSPIRDAGSKDNLAEIGTQEAYQQSGIHNRYAHLASDDESATPKEK